MKRWPPFLSCAWCLFLWVAFLGQPLVLAQADEPGGKTAAVVNRLAGDYRINVFYDYLPGATWKIEGKLAEESDKADLEAFVGILDEEFRKYPATFVHQTHLAIIVLVKDLRVAGQFRAAVPDYGRQVLWLDFKGYLKRANDYQRHVIHHEFYHLIDFELNNSAYWAEPAWVALNPPAFRYGTGGAAAYSNNPSSWFTFSHPEPGFVNRYATTGVEEDKSELFASLLVKSESLKLAEWMKTDAVLRAKTAYLKGILSKIDPAMNDAYWSHLSKS